MVEITEDQYAALLRYGDAGSAGLAEGPEFLELRSSIDDFNKISRYVLLVRFQSVPQGARPAPASGEVFPRGTTLRLELTRKPTRADVDELLRNEATIPELTYVTPDETGTVGWTLLSVYFGV